MKISVVIPTLNEEDFIEDCLKSIRNQTVPVELIVVDSKSDDKTVDIARKFADKVLVGERSIPFNRQRGLEQSSGDIYVSTDADCVFPSDWVENLTSHFEDSKVVAVSGPTKPMAEGSVPLDKIFYFLGNVILGLLHRFNVVWFRGSNSAYRRQVALDAGGYDLDLVAREDSDLSQRVSQRGVTHFDWGVTVMTSMRRREKTGWLKTIKYYIDTPISLIRGKSYYEKV